MYVLKKFYVMLFISTHPVGKLFLRYKNDNILISQLISQLFIIHARVSKHQEIFILFIDVISNSRQFYHTIWLVTKNGYAEITHEFKYTCTT